jgi:gamma-glutamyltranspeptidase/glutathione hydrolase
LVPGFFAGIDAAHRKFGKLPWREIFAPAIYAASEGYLIDPARQAQFAFRKDVLERTPEGRAIFVNKEGQLPVAGDRFCQPELAKTLDVVAREGIDHIYRGDWAKRFVEIVRREGGCATLDDLTSYRPVWMDPFRADFNGYEVCTIGLPAIGGVYQIEGLRLAEEAGLGDPLSSGEALYWLIQICRQIQALGRPSVFERVTRAHARSLWTEMREKGGTIGPVTSQPGTHSDYVLAVDSEGNVAAVCHSINAVLWGATGIFVDGVSIPDSASFQQTGLAAVGQGSYVYSQVNPLIVLKNGRPFLASSSIGTALTEVTLQCLLAVLWRGVDIASTVSMPLVHAPNYASGDSVHSKPKEAGERIGKTARASYDPLAVQERYKSLVQMGVSAADAWAIIVNESPQVIEEGYDERVLNEAAARGARIDLQPATDPLLPRGHWAGIRIDPETRQLQGGRTRYLTGTIETLS